MKRYFVILLLFLCSEALPQTNSRLRFRGYIDTYHAVRVSKPNDFLASRSRFRGELEKLYGSSYFFVSVNAVHNSILPDQTSIQLREAFIEYTGKNWSIKAGRQIIIWGKADGLRITDVISPMDLTEFLAQDYDDIRMPVNGIVLSRFGQNWDLDLVCVPYIETYVLPGPGNPWAMNNQSAEGVVLDPEERPEFSLSDMEYGGKLSFYLSGVDFEVSALNTWNKAPVYSYYYDSTSRLHIRPEYHRMEFLGFGFSKSVYTLIIRGESAFYFNKKFSSDLESDHLDPIERNSINYLVGIDWYPGNEWTITGQFSDEYILDYSNKIANSKHSYISTLGITKKLFRSTLSLSTFCYVGLNEGDLFNRTSIDYALSDNIHITCGADWFEGNNGLFGQYKDNSEIWIKAKYNF